jgi:hypothetical protein
MPFGIVQPDPLVQHPDGEWRFRLPDVVVTGLANDSESTVALERITVPRIAPSAQLLP